MSMWDLFKPRRLGGGSSAGDTPVDDTSGFTNAYVDFTATNNGDGTAANQAASPGGVGARNQLELTDYAPGTSWAIWVRRAGSYTISTSKTWNQTNVYVIGWPVAGDRNYPYRPASGTSNGWNSDSNTYPIVTVADATKSITVSTATNQAFRRIQFQNTAVDAGSHTWFTNTVTADFRYCLFQFAGNGTTLFVNSTTSHPYDVMSGFKDCIVELTQNGIGLLSQFNAATYDTCTFRNTNAGTDGGTVVELKDGDQQLYEDCTFTVTSGTHKQTLFSILTTATTKKCTPTMIGCTFDVGTSTAWTNNLDVGAAVSMISCAFHGFKVSVRSSKPGNPWDPAAFPLHFKQLDFIRPAGSILGSMVNVNCNIDTAAILKENSGTPAAVEIVADNPTFNSTVNDPIVSYSSRFYFKNQPVNFSTIGSSKSMLWLDWPGLFSLDDQGTVSNWVHWSALGCVTKGGPTSIIGSPFTMTEQSAFIYTGVDQLGPSGNSLPVVPIFTHENVLFVRIPSGSRTVTLKVQSNGGAIFNYIWFDVSYLDAGSGGHRTTKSSFTGPLGTMLTWTSLSVNFTAGQDCIGVVRVGYNCIASALGPFDPQVIVT